MDIKAYKKEAINKLKTLEGEIVQLKELTKPIAPENSLGRISRMDAINNKSVNEASLRSLEDRVRNIKLALDRIENKDFGICRKCKTPIPEGRLLLIPGTTVCVNCA